MRLHRACTIAALAVVGLALGGCAPWYGTAKITLTADTRTPTEHTVETFTGTYTVPRWGNAGTTTDSYYVLTDGDVCGPVTGGGTVPATVDISDGRLALNTTPPAYWAWGLSFPLQNSCGPIDGVTVDYLTKVDFGGDPPPEGPGDQRVILDPANRQPDGSWVGTQTTCYSNTDPQTGGTYAGCEQIDYDLHPNR